MSVNLDVAVNYEHISISVVTNVLCMINASIGLYRIEELEIVLHDINDTINREKPQHEHQIEKLHKR